MIRLPESFRIHRFRVVRLPYSADNKRARAGRHIDPSGSMTGVSSSVEALGLWDVCLLLTGSIHSEVTRALDTNSNADRLNGEIRFAKQPPGFLQAQGTLILDHHGIRRSR